MCGLIFVEQGTAMPIGRAMFDSALARQSWRGPDATRVVVSDAGRFLLGHNRLSIVDPLERSDQPMRSRCGRYSLIFNGEIYNHAELRKTLGGEFRTASDTETLLEGYAREGESFIGKLDGMFAFVILDHETRRWIAARDAFGIKPLYIHRSGTLTVIGSEPAIIATLVSASPCPLALQEWRLIRRPLPGKSHFSDIDEIFPGTLVRSDGSSTVYWRRTASPAPFSDEEFGALVENSIRFHEMSDVANVALLSGGLDSAVITALSSVAQCYTVGLTDNNEFAHASETAARLQRTLSQCEVDTSALVDRWRQLTRLRGEPLSVPNEGLISLVCEAMAEDEKVVLTGEGADELLFGYDGIFRWSLESTWEGCADFLRRYGYADDIAPTDRLQDYIETLRSGMRLVDFVEDFFYDVHLPGLLRRMDFASMSASKEARVPFVCKSLVNYLYRRPGELKLSATESKLPLRRLAGRLGLEGALSRRKIGFSAQIDSRARRQEEYAFFQKTIMEELAW